MSNNNDDDDGIMMIRERKGKFKLFMVNKCKLSGQDDCLHLNVVANLQDGPLKFCIPPLCCPLPTVHEDWPG